jgi:hypothetical protein
MCCLENCDMFLTPAGPIMSIEQWPFFRIVIFDMSTEKEALIYCILLNCF